MVTISRRRIAETIVAELEDGMSPTAAMNRAAAYLIEHKRTDEASRLIGDIEALYAQRNIVVADIITARQLDESLRTQLIAVLTDAHKGASIELREHVDETLLGGAIIRTPGKELDDSVMTKLRQLRTRKGRSN